MMRTIEHSSVDKQAVLHLTGVQLARLGIRIINRENLILQCMNCEQTWSPVFDSAGKLPFQYWVCPAKCNQ